MPDKANEFFESIEKLKEVHRIRFDYFKHLTTLSTASIGAIIAFVTKVLPESNCVIIAFISLISFFFCLLAALWAMSGPGNVIFYLTGIQVIATSSEKTPQERAKDAEDYSYKYNRALGQMKCYSKITSIAFLAGIILFLVYAGINLLR
jgi:hypothetical protein